MILRDPMYPNVYFNCSNFLEVTEQNKVPSDDGGDIPDEDEDKLLERISLSPPPYTFTETDALKYISYRERLRKLERMRRKLKSQSIQKLPLEKEFTFKIKQII